MTTTVVLVACASYKLDHPAPAAELYQSLWFKKARAYAETLGDRWYILSAKHGLLAPEQVIEPYDQVLSAYIPRRIDWARGVAAQLRSEVEPKGTTLVILAGAHYRMPLAMYVADYTLDVPMAGLGIGQQIQWLGRRVAKEVAPS